MGENQSGRAPLDLGNVALLPGLINAHTHLEFSDLPSPLGTVGNRLPAWIRQVMAHRHAANRQPASPAPAIRVRPVWPSALAAVRRAVGEIATRSVVQRSGKHRFAVRPTSTVFWEVIGLRPEQLAERLAAAEAHLHRAWPASACASPGLSPHAPYSVHPDLLDRVLRLATAANVPVAMHLAESREELELLAAGSGPFRELLIELGVWSPDVFRGGRRPLDYLRRLAQAPRALAIHGNYLDGEEIEFLAANRSKMSVVFCPRTHAFFAHEGYPLAAMLARGVNVALGTDSRASNPDLSLLAEMRFCAGTTPMCRLPRCWKWPRSAAHGRWASTIRQARSKPANWPIL